MPKIKHPFNEVEATQIACIIVEAYGGSINFYRLMKLMYLVESKVWSKFGMPAMGGEYFSLKDGPIVSEASDAAKGHNFKKYQIWWEHLETVQLGKGSQVRLKKMAGRDEISDGVLEEIKKIIASTRGMKNEELKKFCHSLKEYVEPPVGSRIPIQAEEILEASGASKAHIKQLQSESDSWDLLRAALA